MNTLRAKVKAAVSASEKGTKIEAKKKFTGGFYNLSLLRKPESKLVSKTKIRNV